MMGFIFGIIGFVFGVTGSNKAKELEKKIDNLGEKREKYKFKLNRHNDF